MITKYVITVFFITILHTQFIFAQNDYKWCAEKKYIHNEKLTARFYPYDLSKNNPQFLGDWLKGDVYLENGHVVKNKLFRYNALSDQLVWLRQKDYLTAIVAKENVAAFILYPANKPEMKFVKKTLTSPLNAKSVCFMHELYSGGISLYVRYYFEQNNTNYEINQDKKYFIEKNGHVRKFKPRKRHIFQLFGSEKDTAKNIIRKNKLRIRKTDDLITFFRLYDKH